MFKSLMQPFQLFLKGATGKDRYEKRQITQQLVNIQVAYDRLQDTCDRLQQDHEALQEKYDSLQRDRNDFKDLFHCADKENKEVRSQLQKLSRENVDLTGKVAVLENQISLHAYQHQGSPLYPEDFSAAIDDADNADGPFQTEDLEQLDLSAVSVALIGGHETTHREVTEALKKYGLRRCIHIPPHSIASHSRNQIKNKISNCDLILTITTYVDHSVSQCVKQLKETHMLSGEVVRTSSKGKSGVVREILQYFAA
ncbi:MAG: DUF2325 domain-containing protein [Phormidesmis sp.]